MELPGCDDRTRVAHDESLVTAVVGVVARPNKLSPKK